MKNLHTKEQIEDMRKRLYSRGADIEKVVRHELKDVKVNVSRDWVTNNKQTDRVSRTETRVGQSSSGVLTPTKIAPPVADSAELGTHSSAEKGASAVEYVPENVSSQPEVIQATVAPKKRKYRSFILLGSLIVFIVVAAISSTFLYFDGNEIPSENISVTVQGVPTVGGGEIMTLEVSVVNDNAVPIKSGTLILKYPEGTRSIDDISQNVFEERVSLENIPAGETKTVSLNIVLFGEAKVEKKIEATLEYQVEGSNSQYYKEADPLAVRISSSPLLLRTASIEKVASGQRIEVVLTVSANASNPLKDVLIQASYPNGFTFESANPAPAQRENIWRIEELKPEQSQEIKIEGVIRGLTNEELSINFEGGPADAQDQYTLAAVLAKTQTNFFVERPFIDVEIAINDDSDGHTTLKQGEVAEVSLKIENTLDESVYDMVVEVIPKGNAVTPDSIESSSGFYDSNKGVVRWEVSNNSSFGKILPGSTRVIDYSILQGPNHTESSFDMEVNVYARRVDDSSAQETLIGSVTAEAKYYSIVTIGSQAGYAKGAIPPKVGEATTYNITLVVEADANDLANAVVETSLPIYVDWLNEHESVGTVTYNAVSKKIQWDIGDFKKGERKELTFPVSIRPSLSQVKRIPTLVNKQTVKANDVFTGELLQDSASPVTTELSSEMGHGRDNGEVIK